MSARAGQTKLLASAGFLSALYPIVSTLLVVYKINQIELFDANQINLKVDDEDSSAIEISFGKILIALGIIAIAILPFFETKKPIKWLELIKKFIDKVYKLIRGIVSFIIGKLNLTVSYHANKLIGLATLKIDVKQPKLYAAHFVSGYYLGTFVGLTIFAGIMAYLLYKRKISALAYLNRLINDNLITAGLQFAILFLYFSNAQGTCLKQKKLQKLTSLSKRIGKQKGQKNGIARGLDELTKLLLGSKSKLQAKVDINIYLKQAYALHMLRKKPVRLQFLAYANEKLSQADLVNLYERFSRIKQKLDRLTRGDLDKSIDIEILLTAEPMFNAFIIPGQRTLYFIIGEQVVPYLSEITDDEFIAMFLHEIGHLIFHSETGLVKQVFEIFFVSEILRAFSNSLIHETEEFHVFKMIDDLLEHLDKTQNLINIFRLMEMEADSYVIRKGYGQALISLFKKIGLQYDNIDDVFEIHDSGYNRLEELQKAVIQFEQLIRKGEQEVRLIRKRALQTLRIK